MQGEGAVESIVQGIRELNRAEYGLDVIIAGRGGGSFEDLIAFNDEKVVRAFYNSRVPIVSAVGHQIDHPLSDDAADLTAPTPSAAAELVFPVINDLKGELDYYCMRMTNSLNVKMREYKRTLENLEKLRIFRDPSEIVNMRQMYLNDIENRMTGNLRALVTESSKKLYSVPDISMLMAGILRDKSHELAVAVKALDGLSPLGILGRGYGITRDREGQIVRSVDDVVKGDDLNVQLQDGILHCSIKDIIKEVKRGGAKG